MVQVYAPSGKPTEFQSGSWDNEHMNGYELMNEVGSGGTLSSLFTILSLFTEDVKISWKNSNFAHGDGDDPGLNVLSVPRPGRSKRANSDVSHVDLHMRAQYVETARERSPSVSSSSSTIHPRELKTPTLFASRNADRPTSTPLNIRTQRRMSNHLTQIHHGTVARATEDTTLAVIPAEAFRRLTKQFPNASAHIVQGRLSPSTPKDGLFTKLFLVIMTRFSRVTFNAAHKYLGLTTEVLRTEKAINDIACHPLPPIFYQGGGMQQLRQRFDGVGTQDLSSSQSKPDSDYYGLPPTAVSPRPSTKSQLPSKEASTIDPVKLSAGVRFPSRKSHSSRHLVQAGDLHSSTAFGEAYRPLGRSLSIPHPRRELYETPEFLHFDGVDFDLRQEVMNCIAVSIGLSQPPSSDNTSGEASPSFSAAESTAGGPSSRQGDGFLGSPFALSLLDMGDDSSSATGGSSSVTASGYMSGLDNEVEILFFSSGSYLAKAGERDIGV